MGATDAERFLVDLARALGRRVAVCVGCPRCCRLVAVEDGVLRSHGQRDGKGTCPGSLLPVKGVPHGES